ncbi:MAG: type III effector [Aquificaceae bacterium]|nr:MAG: type III effector [Aquificaceae bacterium]
MNLDTFLNKLNKTPEKIEFADTMAVIENNYDFTETAFSNGDLYNAAGENSGSCKLFSFATLQHLDTEQALACFGAYYRDDVLLQPEGNNHQNIRHFMDTGWGGIKFEGNALALRV